MRVQLLTGLSGPRGSWTTGDLYECEDGEAGRLIAAGFAQALPVPHEIAVEPGPAERAVQPKAKARR